MIQVSPLLRLHHIYPYSRVRNLCSTPRRYVKPEKKIPWRAVGGLLSRERILAVLKLGLRTSLFIYVRSIAGAHGVAIFHIHYTTFTRAVEHG